MVKFPETIQREIYLKTHSMFNMVTGGGEEAPNLSAAGLSV